MVMKAFPVAGDKPVSARGMVRAKGLEPPHLSILVPKTSASTNSATPAKPTKPENIKGRPIGGAAPKGKGLEPDHSECPVGCGQNGRCSGGAPQHAGLAPCKRWLPCFLDLGCRWPAPLLG